MTTYILEVNGKDERILINHIATDLKILQSQKVLDFEYDFNEESKFEKEKRKKERKKKISKMLKWFKWRNKK